MEEANRASAKVLCDEAAERAGCADLSECAAIAERDNLGVLTRCIEIVGLDAKVKPDLFTGQDIAVLVAAVVVSTICVLSVSNLPRAHRNSRWFEDALGPGAEFSSWMSNCIGVSRDGAELMIIHDGRSSGGFPSSWADVEPYDLKWFDIRRYFTNGELSLKQFDIKRLFTNRHGIRVELNEKWAGELKMPSVMQFEYSYAGENTARKAFVALWEKGKILAPDVAQDRAQKSGMSPDDMLEIKELAEWLKVSPATVDRMIDYGKGPPFVQVSERNRRIRRRDAEAWIEERTYIKPGRKYRPPGDKQKRP